MNGWHLLLALPEWILGITALIALFKDARDPDPERKGVQKTAFRGVLYATIAVLLQPIFLDLPLHAFYGHYAVDYFSVVFKLVFGVTALFVLAMADTWLKRVDRGKGEFHLLTLFATLGMFFICSGQDFATLFVSLELITISFYSLTAFKRNDPRSIEAALKYIVLGALASAFLILGIAFLYGATGSLKLADLAQSRAAADELAFGQGALVQFGLLLTLVALGFKIAAVPFQVWAPDVYEGASSPVTAFLSMGSKAAGFVLLLKVVRAAMGPAGDAGVAEAAAWVGLLGMIAAATVLYGNLGAMWQGNMKRLLGYSSIGHAGYLLMGVATFDELGFTAVIYYLIAYLFTVMGVFAVVVIVNGVTRSHDLKDYAGLGKRSPLLALVLTCGLLSLAGVPPFGGFFGKFMIFNAVIAKGGAIHFMMAAVGALGVVISLYYYLRVVGRLYLEEPHADSPTEWPISRPMRWVLYVCLAGVFLTGTIHRPFMAMAQNAAQALLAGF